jgi:predicted phosphodiesterase
MNTFLRICAAAMLICLAATPQEAQDKPASTPASGPAVIIAGPYLQQVTQTGITIMWETGPAASGLVECGKGIPLGRELKVALDHKTAQAGSRQIHKVVLTGLEAGADYSYRVVSRTDAGAEQASEVYTFQTAVGEDTPYTFGIISDTQYANYTGKLTDLLYTQRPNFCINGGDLTGGTDGADPKEWREGLLKPAAKLMQHVAMFCIPGNHDVSYTNYFKYLSAPEPQYRYTFAYGNAQFFMLDSNRPCDEKSEQYQWLDQELAKSKATWKFVVHHHPVFSSEQITYSNTRGDARVADLKKLYEKYGVDIVFNGHSHNYERTWPIKDGHATPPGKGVIYMVIAGSGSWQEECVPVHSWFTCQQKLGFFCGTVAVNGKELHLRMMDISGNVFDWLDLSK